MNIHSFSCNVLHENCYVVSQGGIFVIIDPGFDKEEEFGPLMDYLAGAVPAAILLTHGHFDHTLGVVPLQALWPEVPVYMNPVDQEVLEDDVAFAAGIGLGKRDFSFKWKGVADGEILNFGQMSFKAIYTPGHTRGCISWYCEKEGLLFSGDTLFAGAIGRTDFGHGDYDAEIKSIMEGIILLPPETEVLPGHGPCTTIGRERDTNPFLEPWGEPEETFDEDLPGIEIHP